MTDTVEATARAVLDAKLDRDSAAPVAVAVSGGGDSIALLQLAADWAAGAGRPLLVLTVDHRLHPDSARWAGVVEVQARALGLPCRVLPWTAAKPETGLPAAARRARHKLLATAARQEGARVILFGHTLDDHRENQLIRLDATPMGRLWTWSPSPVWPEGRGVYILRPLLSLRRESLRGWLQSPGASWIEDPGNADLRFSRARARAKLAAWGRPDWDEDQPWTVFERRPSPALGWTQAHPDGRITTDRPASAQAADGRLGVRASLNCAGGGDAVIKRERFEALMARLGEPLRQPVAATLAGAKVMADWKTAAFGRVFDRAPPAPVAAAAGETIVWDGRFEVTPEEDGVVVPARGLLAGLSKAERASLQTSPAWVRPTLPLLRTNRGTVRLAPARSLVAERLRGALGAYASERDLP